MSVLLAYAFYFIAGTIFPLYRRRFLRDRIFTVREQITFTFQVLSIMFTGSLFFPFFSPFYIHGDLYHLFLLALVCGVFGAATNILQYIVWKHVEAGVSTVVGNIYTPITIVLSSIFLHEGLTPIQVVGTVLLLFAIVIVSEKHRIGRFSFDKYFLLLLLSGAFLAVVLVAERALQKTTGFSAGIMLSWGAQAFFLGLAVLFYGNKHTYNTREVLTTGSLQFFHALSWVSLVFIAGNLSVVASITTFKVVIIFITAAIFLHEREDVPRKVIGCIIAVAGLLLMR